MLIEQLTGQVTSHLTKLVNGALIHSAVVSDFTALQNAAKKSGFNLQIASGFRSFERQCIIWNNKYSGNTIILDKSERAIDLSTISELEKLFAILHWSALPGASRHHWGTDLDIYDPDLLPKNKKLQLNVSEYTCDYFLDFNQWVSENIGNFGFYRPYQSDNGGVAIEPWHISYFPIANEALKQLDLRHIHKLIAKNNILGKSLICTQLPMIYENFICNVNQQYNGI